LPQIFGWFGWFGWFIVIITIVKKSFLLLLVVSLFGIVGCGSDDGDEAVEGRTKNFFLEDQYVAEFDGAVEACAQYVRKYQGALQAKEKFDLVDVDSAFDLGDMADLVVFYSSSPKGVNALGELQFLTDLDDQYGLLEQSAERGFVNVFGMLNESSFGSLLKKTGFTEGAAHDLADGIKLSDADSFSDSPVESFTDLYAATRAADRYALLEAYNLTAVLGIGDVSDLLDLGKIFDDGELNARTVDRYGVSWSSIVGEQSREQGFELNDAELAKILEIQAYGKLLRMYSEMEADGLLDGFSGLGDFRQRIELFEIISNLEFLEGIGMLSYPALSENLGLLDCDLSAVSDGDDSGPAAVEAYNVSSGVPACESFDSQQDAQTWFDFNAFQDFDRSSLDPNNVGVPCIHEGSPWPLEVELSPPTCENGEQKPRSYYESNYRVSDSIMKVEPFIPGTASFESIMDMESSQLFCWEGSWMNYYDYSGARWRASMK
jgi:hypothetical protein